MDTLHTLTRQHALDAVNVALGRVAPRAAVVASPITPHVPRMAVAISGDRIPCAHRGQGVGTLNCQCGGSPTVYACQKFRRCLLHAPSKPYPLDLVNHDGAGHLTRETIHSSEAPKVCAICDARGENDRLTWPAPESWNPEQLRFLRVADLAQDTMRLIPQLPPNASGIVGIPRSGMLPAGVLATSLQLPLYYLDPDRGPVPMPGGGRERLLRRGDGPLIVVDDTTWRGLSMQRARQLLGNTPAIYTAVYVRDPKHVDLYAVHHPGSHVLEWNIFNNAPLAGSPAFREFVGGAACDFDGILCEDPIVSDHVDLPRFLAWLSNARPLYVPRQVPVRLVISFRLEAWRAQTQAWLDRWGIRVQEMVLHPAATVQDRNRRLDVAGHKGKTLAASRCTLMFESDPAQCQTIYDTAHKHVICPRTAQVWQADAFSSVSLSAKSIAPHNSVSLSRLAVITCLFAAVPSRNRAANFRDFSASLQASGVELHGIEGLYDGQTPLTTPGDRWRHVRLVDRLWHKERLLNLLVETLPSDYDAVAWLDADLLFSDPAGLPGRIMSTLSQYPVAQAWEIAEQLGANDKPSKFWNDSLTMRSMASVNAGKTFADTHAGRSHAGFAWAMRRDAWRAIGGLYEREVNGGADATMCSAFWGDVRNGRWSQLNPFMQSEIAAWSDRASTEIRARVGCVPGMIRHLYHGTLPNRRYWPRLLSVSSLGYDPQSHLVVNPGQPLRWSDSAPQELRDWLDNYLCSLRCEDDTLRAAA